MAAYTFDGTTTCGIPVRVEVGFIVSSQAYRMEIVCPAPELVGDADPCLFSTDDIPAELKRPEPAHLESILEGFGIRPPFFIQEIWRQPTRHVATKEMVGA